MCICLPNSMKHIKEGLYSLMFDISREAREACWHQITYSIKAKISQNPATRNLIWGPHITYVYQMTKVNVWDTVICFLLWLSRMWQIFYRPGVYFPVFVQMLRVHQKDSHSSPDSSARQKEIATIKGRLLVTVNISGI